MMTKYEAITILTLVITSMATIIISDNITIDKFGLGTLFGSLTWGVLR